MSDVFSENMAFEDRDGNLALEVRRAQLEPIYAQNINAFVGQLLSAFVNAFLIWTVVPTSKLLIWLAVMVVVQGARYLHSLQFKALPRPLLSEQVTFWLRAHVIFTALTALIWSVGAIFLWTDSSFHQVVFTVVILFTVAAAMVGHTSYKLSYAMYTFMAMVPVSLWFIIDGSRDYIGLGIALLIGTVMLLRIAERTNKARVQALWIGVQYRNQANLLADEKLEIERLNEELVSQTKAAQESEARFRALSEAAFEGIAIHDRGKIMDANHAALEMVGYDLSEINGLTIRNIVVPESYEIVEQRLREDYELPYELVGVRKDGSTFPIEVQGKTIPFNEGEARVVAFRDITIRKELAEKALALNLEQARLHLLTTFIQNASHEFRTPLSIISLSAYIIGRTDEPEKRDQKIIEINDQVDRINMLVNALLFMLKLDTDVQMNIRPVDLNALLESVINPLKPDFTIKQQVLQIDLDPQLQSIPADADLLNEAFSALLKNASRYTTDGGTIAVRTRCSADHITVEIQDNGIGIAEEALNRIFERFYRIDEAHSTAGFGIGLAITKSIIELHRGTISVHSEVDKGSTFVIQLPHQQTG